MNHRDAEITEIVIVIHERFCDQISETVER